MKDIPPNLEFEHLIWQQGVQYIAGVDEAGRGPLAGPVVAAAVIFLPYFYISDVRDSKKLTPKKREELFERITREAVAWAVGVVSPAEIDRINIRNATFKAMRQAIGKLRVQPQYLLLDGEELPDRVYPQEAIVGGDDKSFTIAAASIVAKVYRDRLMQEYHVQYPRYGFDKHKGYGTKHHQQMLLKFGPCPIHRRSFLRKLFGER